MPNDHPLTPRRFIGDKPIDITRELKHVYGAYCIFVQNGFFWEVFEDDAHMCSQLFGWKLAIRGSNSVFTGVPINAFRFKEKLEARSIAYIMVGQAEHPPSRHAVERLVVEVFDA